MSIQISHLNVVIENLKILEDIHFTIPKDTFTSLSRQAEPVSQHC